MNFKEFFKSNQIEALHGYIKDITLLIRLCLICSLTPFWHSCKFSSPAGVESTSEPSEGETKAPEQTSGTSGPLVLTQISVTSAGGVTLAQGDVLQLKAEGKKSDNTISDITKEVQWSSSIPEALTVSTEGIATALGTESPVLVKAQKDGIEGTLSISLVKRVSSLPEVTVTFSISGNKGVTYPMGYPQDGKKDWELVVAEIESGKLSKGEKKAFEITLPTQWHELVVSGDCPGEGSSFSEGIYSTGPIEKDCQVIFEANTGELVPFSQIRQILARKLLSTDSDVIKPAGSTSDNVNACINCHRTLTGISTAYSPTGGFVMTTTPLPTIVACPDDNCRAQYIDYGRVTENLRNSQALIGTYINTSAQVALANTTGLLVGDAVTGTGVQSSTTISSVDSSTQITLNKLPNNLTFNRTISKTGIIAYGNSTIGLSDTSGLTTGVTVTGKGIPASTTISAINANSITISKPAQATGSATYSFVTNTYSYSSTYTPGSAQVTVTNTSGLLPGDQVVGPGIPDGTTILTVDNGTTVTLSTPATNSPLSRHLTFTRTITKATGNSLTSGSNVVTVSSTSDLFTGFAVTGTGIAPGTGANGTAIVSIDSPTQITLNKNAVATGTPSLTFTGMPALKEVPRFCSATACSDVTYKRVDPGSPLTSLICLKTKASYDGNTLVVGELSSMGIPENLTLGATSIPVSTTTMPNLGPIYLPTPLHNKICRWVLQGAQNN